MSRDIHITKRSRVSFGSCNGCDDCKDAYLTNKNYPYAYVYEIEFKGNKFRLCKKCLLILKELIMAEI